MLVVTLYLSSTSPSLNTVDIHIQVVLIFPSDNTLYQYRLRLGGIESSPAQKDSVVPEGERVDMTQPRALPAQRAKRVLGCIQSSVGSRAREGILHLCSPEAHPQSNAPSSGVPFTRRTPVGATPEECHRHDQRAGAPFL